MAVNSKKKGNAGEREWAKWLMTVLGVYARRGVQYQGSPISPDVVSSLKEIHWEVKRVEKHNLDKSMLQSIRDAAPWQVPVVAHRKNRSPWLVTLRADDIEAFCEAIVNREKCA